MRKLIAHFPNAIFQVLGNAFFKQANTIPLEVVRMGLGFLLLFNYGLYSWSDVLTIYGTEGILAKSYVPDMLSIYSFSLFGFLNEDWQILIFHNVFLVLCFCLLVGWKTRWIKWLVLIVHMSYVNRNWFASYGVDHVAIAILLPLCIAPIGSALSLDRVRAVRRYKELHGLNVRPEIPKSAIGFGCQRLIQLQMAVIYFSSGIEKLYGDPWWDGVAPWTAMVNNETAFFPMDVFASNFWLVSLLAYGTVLLEIAYPFLIWGRNTRPYFLIAALGLHVGIAVFLGMYYFAALMSFGHLAFMRREWYAAAGQLWKQYIGSMEMLYDGKCGFCKRSMALFLAFDGLTQIKAKDFRRARSLPVTKEQANKALYTITSDNQSLPGFDGYQHVVLRVPGMWFLVPLFCIPWLSRAVGSRIYSWVAKHRMELSQQGY